jgi:transposase
MFLLAPRPRFFLSVVPTDMRKGFDALCGLVRNQMQADPMGDNVFVFVNRARTQIRLLYFDGDGFVIVAKRLEQGTFAGAPTDAGSTVCSCALERRDLLLMLEGIDRLEPRRRRRYARP